MSGFSDKQVRGWEQEALRQLPQSSSEMPLDASPLRVAMLGWSWVPFQEREGSGLNLSLSELAAALAARGHRVMYLRSGMQYSLRPGMRVSHREVWRGVSCFELVNSPNLATGNFNFRNPEQQISSPDHSAIVADWLRAVRADVVHIHSFEGFAFDVVKAARNAGVPVVCTPHNYYALCPQVDLMHKERETCEDYDGGRKCVGCIVAPAAAQEARVRSRRQFIDGMLGANAARGIDRVCATLASKFAGLLRLGTPAAAAPANRSIYPMPVSSSDTNERLLAAKDKLIILNPYGRRRHASVAALNFCNLITCPGRLLMKVHESFGVEPSRLRHVPLGQPHFDQMRRVACDLPGYAMSPWTPQSTSPLRFAYFGSTKPNKGLDTLCRAVLAMPAEERRRCRFVIRGIGDLAPFRAMLKECHEVEFLGQYATEDLSSTVGGYDVGLFLNMGLENSPFVLLEYLNAGKFTIASSLGAPGDWVRPGANGMLVNAGDVQAWAGAMLGIIRGDVRLPSAQEIHAASELATFDGYVESVLRSYQEVRGGKH